MARKKKKGLMSRFFDYIMDEQPEIERKELDSLTGFEFESFLARLYVNIGYKVEITNQSGDFGADLIIKKKDKTTVVQAKRYSSKVGLRAVQEIASSRNYYKATKALVVTTNYFTPQAIELAKVNDVKLIDRDGLMELILKEEKTEDWKKKYKDLIQRT